ncbi:MAG: AI-2E family transporter [Nanoarchaeota archaeon]|nr:AI-2E family transporter [Nanoarchaeota archaeon]
MELNNHRFTKLFFIALFALLVYISYKMISPYIGSILLSLFIVYILYPIYQKIKPKIKNDALSSFLMTLLVLILIILPLIFIGNILISETSSLYNSFYKGQLQTSMSNLFIGQFDSYIAPLLQNAANYLIKLTSSFLLSLPQKILGIIISLFVLYYSFKNGEKIVQKIKELLPLKNKNKKKIIDMFKNTMDATIHGTILFAILEGLFAIFGYWYFGLSTPILWGLLTGIIAMLPVIGPAAVYLPLAIYLAYKGNIAGAIGLVLYSGLILTFLLDIVLKNKVIGKKGKIHPIIVLLGVIGGLHLFGMVGVIIGPFLLSVTLLFIKIIVGENAIKS